MSHGADEVAEDFKVALQDLTLNSRYEISNLTVIAKENTEHALAISEALKEHIRMVRQQPRCVNGISLERHFSFPAHVVPY